jgi:hypothetical protein
MKGLSRAVQRRIFHWKNFQGYRSLSGARIAEVMTVAKFGLQFEFIRPMDLKFNIIYMFIVIKSGRMRWAGHDARMGDVRNG